MTKVFSHYNKSLYDYICNAQKLSYYNIYIYVMHRYYNTNIYIYICSTNLSEKHLKNRTETKKQRKKQN